MTSTRLRQLMGALRLAAVLGTTACSMRPGSAEAGRSLYRQNGCGSCHGGTGRADGPVSQALDPRPADLTMPAAFKRGAGEDDIAQTLAVGIPAPDSIPGMEGTAHHHSQGMPPYGHLTLAERRSLARYILTLQQEHTR